MKDSLIPINPAAEQHIQELNQILIELSGNDASVFFTQTKLKDDGTFSYCYDTDGTVDDETASRLAKQALDIFKKKQSQID